MGPRAGNFGFCAASASRVPFISHASGLIRRQHARNWLSGKFDSADYACVRARARLNLDQHPLTCRSAFRERAKPDSAKGWAQWNLFSWAEVINLERVQPVRDRNVACERRIVELELEIAPLIALRAIISPKPRLARRSLWRYRRH
jgi:hypothetical protein